MSLLDFKGRCQSFHIGATVLDENIKNKKSSNIGPDPQIWNIQILAESSFIWPVLCMFFDIPTTFEHVYEKKWPLW